MKRVPILFCLVVAIFVLFSPTAQAVGPNGIIDVQLFHWTDRTYTPATADTVKLTLNGDALSGDVPAMLRDSRTIVPVRLVSEALDIQVLWVQETGQVVLMKDADVIVLTLDSDTAMVNGVATVLPDGVPAHIVSYQGADRTMVPLRFVSEHLGATIEWEQSSYTAHISAELPQPPAEPAPEETLPPTQTPPAETPLPTPGEAILIEGIQSNPHAQTIRISTTGVPEYKVQDYSDRVVIDVFNARLAPGFPSTTRIDNEAVTSIRYAQHDDASLYPDYEQVVRVVLEYDGEITLDKNFDVETQASGILVTTYLDGRPEPEYVPNRPIDPHKSTIVLDAGHGGEQSGAFYEEIAEKDINLAVTLKLEAILLDHGYNVILTRRTDATLGLYDRADIANAVEADIFVSLHSNAAVTKPEYTGAYTYYFPESVRGSLLAATIQGPLCQYTGAIDRGIRDADFVVLRETDMPAVLVEMGFMTNHDELMNLTDGAYQQKLAEGIAEGIIAYLNAQGSAATGS